MIGVFAMASEETVRKLIDEAYGNEMKIIDIKSQQGTKPGENYGSIMTAFTVTMKTKNHNQFELHLMAKALPPSQFIRDVFNVDVTFPKEVEFYEVVLPEYIKLLEEHNVDIDYKKAFPNFMGARLETQNGAQEATLLMENIKMEGYRLGKKSEGLNLEQSKLVIKEIAIFHALGKAMKLKKPDIYESKIKKAGRPLKGGQSIDTAKAEIHEFLNQSIDYLNEIDEIVELVPRLRKVMKENFIFADMVEGYEPREPFTTLVHNDLWFNNIMFKYDDDGKPVAVKLLDFQRTKVGSPVSDLMMFLYVSTSLDVMKSNFDDLLKLYHDHFIDLLMRLGVSTENLRWDDFQKELKHASEEVSMPVAMLRLLFIKVEGDMSEFDMDAFGKMTGGDFTCRIRHIEVLRDLARRGWV